MTEIPAITAVSAIRGIEPVGHRGAASYAMLEAARRRLTKELSDLRAAQAATSRTGQADIEALEGKIAAIEARLARQAQPARLPARPG